MWMDDFSVDFFFGADLDLDASRNGDGLSL